MSLKEQNKKALWAAMIANALAFALVVQGQAVVVKDLATTIKDWSALVPATTALVLVGLLNALLDSNAKARLVFWRWSCPMPGAEAFTKWGPRDDRVDMTAVGLKFGPLPHDRAAQNKLWYRLYQTVQTLPAVEQVHREFLLARDIASLTVILFLVLAPAAFVFMPVVTAAVYVGALLVEYAIATRAARVHGARFVTTVLALKGAGK